MKKVKPVIKKTPVVIWEKAQSYVGLKQIDASPMNRGAYNKFRGWNVPPEEDHKDKGFIVRYPDGYISWSPTEQFVNSYMKTTAMDFSAALFLMKIGEKVARKGWNGKKMWVTISEGTKSLPANKFWNKHNKAFAKSNGGKADVEPFLTMKNAQGKIQMGWAATQSDMLANDWCIIE